MDSTNLNLPSTSIEGFSYEVRIDRDCEIFKTEPFCSELPNFGEMLIESEWFARQDDCIDDAVKILTSIAHLQRACTEKKYVIATKVNPMHAEDYEPIPTEPWEGAMILKLFVAEVDRLREGFIVANAMAVIRAAPRVNLAIEPTHLIPQ